jgi:hypothetical protein
VAFPRRMRVWMILVAVGVLVITLVFWVMGGTGSAAPAGPPVIRVVDTKGNPMAGMRVDRRWEDFGYVKRGDDSAVTDAAGNAVFPVVVVTGTTSNKVAKLITPDGFMHMSTGEMSQFDVECPVGYRTRMPSSTMTVPGQYVTVSPGGVRVYFERMDNISFTVTVEAVP